MAVDPTYIVCPDCGSDRFLLSRRIYTIPMVDGKIQRNWAESEISSSEIVCSSCGARLRWDAATQKFVVFQHGWKKEPQ